MTDTSIPDVKATDLTREEMEAVAAECGIDPDGLDDQKLLERLGTALGELDAKQAAAAGGRGRKRTRVDELRGRLASLLDRAADKVRPTEGGRRDPAAHDVGTNGEDPSRVRAAAQNARQTVRRAVRRARRRGPGEARRRR